MEKINSRVKIFKKVNKKFETHHLGVWDTHLLLSEVSVSDKLS